jgi:hypothetical protein
LTLLFQLRQELLRAAAALQGGARPASGGGGGDGDGGGEEEAGGSISGGHISGAGAAVFARFRPAAPAMAQVRDAITAL